LRIQLEIKVMQI